MIKPLSILIFLLFYAKFTLLSQSVPMPADNFEGIITYVGITKGISTDTTIVYFGKSKIRVQQVGKIADEYGLTNTLYDFSHTSLATTSVLLFNTGETRFVERTGGRITSIEKHQDTVMLHDTLPCEHHTIHFLPHERFGGMFSQVVEVYSNPEFRYVIPDEFKFEGWAYGNAIGNIALEIHRTTSASYPDGTVDERLSISRAIKIEPMELPEAYFDLY